MACWQTNIVAVLLLSEIFCCAAVNIAIIGAGISGTSTAYFLRQLLKEKANITLFDGKAIGGRLSTITVDGCEYETGGAIIHEKNKYASELAGNMGLRKIPDRPGEIFGLYDEGEFLFIGSRYFLLNTFKLLWRYGLDVYHLDRYTNELLAKFERIYDIQDKNNSFISLDDLMSAIDPVFVRYMDVSTFNGFKEHGFSPQIINELIQATLKCNYGQTTSVHQFVGSVSVAGAGSALFSLEGGNKLLPSKLLEASNAHFVNTFVKEVILVNAGSENQEFVVVDQNGSSGQYDIVVVSTPLTADPRRPNKIKLTGFPHDVVVPGNYWTTVCTIVKGDINPKFFGFDTVDNVPDLIISVANDSLFNSIGKISPVRTDSACINSGTPVWKIFSKQILELEKINLLFEKVYFHQTIDWLAYPHYDLERHIYNFTLYDKLFYSNAMEWSASAIETSIIGARNVALLIKQRFDDEKNIPVDFLRSTAHLHDEM